MTAGEVPARSLPELRADLRLLRGAADVNGHPTWLIHDLAANRFIQVDAAAYEALAIWRECATDVELIDRITVTGRVSIERRSIQDLVSFLHANEMTVDGPGGGAAHFYRRYRARQHSLPAWLVHNYLFFRIPLIAPQPFLVRSLPAVRIVWTTLGQIAVFGLGLLGLYLASRQWEAFVSTFQGWMTFEGASFAFVTLVVVKLAHELGHAYAAVRFGCRVHSMGIAFVVMTPMPYTDVTDAWKLRDRRQRVIIDSAGMLAELMIACLALFAWGMLADGPLRSMAFFVATVSIASSLTINLNPFMRFDGYYLFSEMTAIENLQSRAFDVGIWAMREVLFGIGAPCPEEAPRSRIAWLSAYAWSIWLYRLVLFFGIALLVYHLFFKMLGIVLFGVEVVYFIARPIAGELKVWWSMRSVLLAKRRTRAILGVACLGAVAATVPLSRHVEVPAIVEATDSQPLHAVRSARVKDIVVKQGDAVKRGDVIVRLESTDIDDDIRRSRISLDIVRLQFGRRIADASDRESSLVLESSIAAYEARLAGLEKERAELTIVAPFDGMVTDFNPDLHVGRWIGTRDPIAIVVRNLGGIVRGYVSEADIGRIKVGRDARFVPEQPMRGSAMARVEIVSPGSASHLEIADLASVNAGRIASGYDERRRLVPTGGQYQLTAVVLDGAPLIGDLSARGVLVVEATPESLVSRFWRRAVGIAIRESGF